MEHDNCVKTFEKQIKMYQETTLALTEKCQELETNKIMSQSDMRKSLENIILAKSPGNFDLDFLSLDGSGGFKVV